MSIPQMVMPKGALMVMQPIRHLNWQYTEARKMSNLTKINKLMVDRFIVSLEAILWPKSIWKPQSTLLWERRRKRLFGGRGMEDVWRQVS
ncbi:hypothetical protein BTE48_16335 [Oceanospirillum multiglobuliferum]|uniref:Uncharacterized protein n=2 Tax=Oceanospirillum multiglobuliferum TaxID=64969 RepID=A0A1V4T1K3_9GAMM|nr:hypothetical protein BTE48_16335 [Oceanospirillum multiglobuliferum]